MPDKLKTAIAVIGIDIGKNSFHVVGLDERGAVTLRQKWSRGQVEARFANMPPCLIGMEACVGAHHLSRRLKALGHDARLMPAKYVRPYSKGQKNDFRDAEAIAEAVQRPTMKFVATKTAEQLDLQALHRVRERLVSQRTGTINQIRAFLLERGIAVRQGQRFLRAELPHILATPLDVLSPRMVRTIEDLAGDWHRLDDNPDFFGNWRHVIQLKWAAGVFTSIAMGDCQLFSLFDDGSSSSWSASPNAHSWFWFSPVVRSLERHCHVRVFGNIPFTSVIRQSPIADGLEDTLMKQRGR